MTSIDAITFDASRPDQIADLTTKNARANPEITDGTYGNTAHRFTIPVVPGTALKLNYIRQHWRLSGPVDGTAPVLADDVAPAFNMAANTIDKIEIRVNDTIVSEVNRDFGDVDTMRKRLMKKGSMMTVFEGDMNWMQNDFLVRQNHTASDGVIEDGVSPSFVERTGPQLGFPAASTWSYDEANDQVNFLVLGAIDLTEQFRVGDQFVPHRADSAAAAVAADLAMSNSPAVITAVTDDGANAGQLTLATKLSTLDLAAATAANGNHFSRRRYEGVNLSRRTREFITHLKPAMGAWDADNLPAGNWEIDIHPRNDADWRRGGVESLNSNLVHGTDYHLFMVRTEINYSTYRVARPADGLLPFELGESAVSKKNIRQQDDWVQFHVDKDTIAASFGVQDTRVLSDTRLNNSRLRAFDNAFLIRQDRLYSEWDVRAGGRRYPVDDRPFEFTPGIDTLSHIYGRNMRMLGQDELSSPESLRTWLDNGAYIYLDLVKESDNLARLVEIKFKFAADPLNSQVVLLTLYNRKFQFMMQGGRVTAVIMPRK